MHWKFLLFGITGNLAKIKILPGLAEFASLNQDKVSVELIGYSRSKPNLDEIEKVLNSGLSKNSNLDYLKAKHNLTNITFEQGSYEDGKVLFENIAKLKTHERLVVYLAVPPSTFLKFLQNACPYGDQNVDFIIEKPFGRDPIEAAKLLNLVESCGLEQQVHFCDHYLFKNSTLLKSLETLQIREFFKKSNIYVDNSDTRQNLEQNEIELNEKNQNSQKLDKNEQTSLENSYLEKQNPIKNEIQIQQKTEISKPIFNSIFDLSKIHIQILENVDLKGRSGYFDTTGALKDMWPHLFSLFFLTLENAGFETNFEIEVAEILLGQYQSYADEEGLSNSKTETYFWIKLKIKNEIQNEDQNKKLINSTQNDYKNTNKNTEIILESGKNLPKKITQMTLESWDSVQNMENLNAQSNINLDQTQPKKSDSKTEKTFIRSLNWSIYPYENITLTKNFMTENIVGEVLDTKNENAANYSQNQDKIDKNVENILEINNQIHDQNKTVINLKREKLDQTNLFELLLADNKERFVKAKKIKKSWDWWQKITDFTHKNNIQIVVYPDQTLPKIIEK